MGGIIGGLLAGASKTDRKAQLTSFSDLSNVFNFALPTAQDERKRGDANMDTAMSSLGLSSDYYKKILSGNRTEVAQAVEPTTNAINSSADAAKRNLEMSGTSRGGGVNAENQQIEDKKRTATDSVIAQARPQAAAGLNDVASREAAIGESQLAAAMSALGIGTNAAGTLGKLSGETREADLKREADEGAAIANIAMAFMGL